MRAEKEDDVQKYFDCCWVGDGNGARRFCAECCAGPSGNIADALTKLDAYVKMAMEKTHVPGAAVAVVYKDQVVFAKGYGVRKVGERLAVDPDTVFEIASLSKPITSTVVASLVSSGDVKWDDRIEELDPEFKLSDPSASEKLTIRDLLSHRSGLPTTDSGDLLEDLGYTRPYILRKVREVPLAGAFGRTYHYSNFGFTEGAIAAAKKVGKPWEDIAEDRLFERIGMLNTSARFSDYENNPNKASLHVLEDGVYQNRFVREADAEAPAGGVSSNVRDLAQWMRLQLGNGNWNGHQIISAEALEETHKPEICNSIPGPVSFKDCPGQAFYGLGWNVGHDPEGRLRIGHSGAFLAGAGTTVYLIPSEQIGIVVLGNSTPVGLPEAVGLAFLDFFHYGEAKADYLAITEAYFKKFREEAQNASTDYSVLPPPKDPTPGRPLSSYVGKYFNHYYGVLEIGLERGQLFLRLPPMGAYYELKHWNGDTFTYYFASENTGVGRRGLKFSGDQVVVENLATTHNNGTFRKIQ